MKYDSLLKDIAALLEKQERMDEKQPIIDELPSIEGENPMIPFDKFIDLLSRPVQKALKYHEFTSFDKLLLYNPQDFNHLRYFTVKKVKEIQGALQSIGLSLAEENRTLTAIKRGFSFLRMREQNQFLQWCRFNIND